MTLSVEDVLGDSINLFGDEKTDDETIRYGPLVLTAAAKEGKANTLLADHLFSPSLLLAERIERGLITLAGQSVIELGAGCALPTLLSATLADSPSLVVITDYPDETILGNLRRNVDRNQKHFSPQVSVHWTGYEWGQDVSSLIALSAAQADGPKGYNVVVLSDLLHFDASHDVLLYSLTSLLAPLPTSRAYVAAGKYTVEHVCDHFLHEGKKLGIMWEDGEEGATWRGELPVHGGGLDREQLGIRKGMCRWWVGRWSEERLSQW